MAAFLGAGDAADAFRVAFLVPNMLRRVFGEGAFSQAFVPVLASYRTSSSDAAMRRLIAGVITCLLFAVGTVTIFGVLGADVLARLFGDGFFEIPGKHELTSRLLRTMFPYLALVSSVALLGAVLNCLGRFGAPAFVPSILNLAMIASLGLSAPLGAMPVEMAAGGVLIGGVAQVGFLYWFVRRAGMSVNLGWPPFDEGVARVARLMVPAILGASLGQLSLLLNTRIASGLPAGSVSWLGYADRLMEFPVALLGIPIGTAILPALVRRFAEDDNKGYSHALDAGLKVALLISAPAAVLMFVAARPLVYTLLMRGEFSELDAGQSAAALGAYGTGLVALIAGKVLAPAYFARQNIRAPLLAAVVSLTMVQVVNLVSVPRLGHVGLAVSISAGAWVNMLLLFVGLLKIGVIRPSCSSAVFVLRVAAAALVMFFVAVELVDVLAGAWAARSSLWQRTVALAFVIAVPATVYLVALFVAGVRPMHLRFAAER